jgi:hypothetical protein
LDTLLFVVSIAAVGHFGISLLLWALLVRVALSVGDDVDWTAFLHAAPAVVLFALFVTCTVLVWRGRKMGRILLVTGLALSVALFIFDATNRNWQVHAENYHGQDTGPTFHYYNWWWYGERWFE